MSEIASIPQKMGIAARFLPAPLIQARSTVFERFACLDLNRTARQAMYGLLAFFNVRKPDQPIWANRDSICKESLLGSVQTLYRGLAELETHGYIVREQIRRASRQSYGQFSYSYIWFTVKARVLLGLPVTRRENRVPETADCDDDPIEAWEAIGEWEDDGSWHDGSNETAEPAAIQRSYGRTPPKQIYPHGPSLTVRDRIQEGERTLTPQLSRKEQPEQQHCQPDKAEVSGGFQEKIAEKSRLPKDVTPLLGLGVSKPRICMLMRLAREAGKQGMLGDVIRVAHTSIAHLRGTPVFLYLKKMISQPADYTSIATKMIAKSTETAKTTKSKARLEQTSIELEGRSFKTRDGQIQVFVQAKGMLRVFDPRRGVGYRPMDAEFLEALDAGRLVGCSI